MSLLTVRHLNNNQTALRACCRIFNANGESITSDVHTVKLTIRGKGAIKYLNKGIPIYSLHLKRKDDTE